MSQNTINIRTVASKCNVSTATVSRVVNNSGYVSESTRRKVLNAIEELGYRHNKVASNLRKRNTSYIGLIVPSISYEFFAELARNIEKRLQKENFSLFLCNSDEDFEKEQFYIDSLINNQASGLILVSADPEKSKQFIEESNIPLVLVDRFEKSYRKRENIVCVTSDNFEGGKMAAEELLSEGAKKIAVLMTSKKTRPQSEREDGFITAMIRNKTADVKYKIFETDSSPKAVSKRIAKIQKKFDFDALFCGNDRIAFGAMYALIESGRKIPKNVKLVGFDDIEIGQYLKPALTTIRQDVAKIGEVAAAKIIEMVTGGSVLNERVVVPTELIKRDTT